MAKTNIWMAFYPKDYFGDTTDLTTQQHGAYLLLIMTYFATGKAPRDNDEELARITKLSRLKWRKERPRIERFFTIHKGFWRHKRVERELSRSKNLSKMNQIRARKRWETKSENGVPKDDLQANTTKTPMPRHSSGTTTAMPDSCYSESESESESQCTKAEREYGSADRPSWEEVKFYADKIGLAEWKARDWFDEMEGGGWLDHNKRPVAIWQSILNRVKTKWEADDRPAGPPSNAPRAGGARPMSPLDLKTIIGAKETEANAIKAKFASETAMGMSWNDQEKRAAWVAIRKEIKALNQRLSQMA